MLDLLKKIGIPASVAAVIATLITILPFIFKLDERYAKASALEDGILKVEKQTQALAVEVGRLAGIQQVMVTILAQSNVRTVEVAPTALPPEPFRPTPAAPTITETLTSTAIEKPVARVEVKPLIVEPVIVPAAPAPNSTHAEKNAKIEQVQRALEASQRNIEKIQKY